jgi:hypothetical protein
MRTAEGRAMDAWTDWIDCARFEGARELCARVRRSAAVLPQPASPREGEPYSRTLLARTAHGEVMLAAWREGARCAPHDHGGASGFVLVLAGSFRETRFEFDGEELRKRSERCVRAWEYSQAPEAAIHDLCAERGGITLHVYAPCIERMRVFDVEQRATLLVPGDRGAWVQPVAERAAWKV